MNLENVSNEDLSWCKAPVIGLVLLAAEHDSHGDPIDAHRYYSVARHVSGMLLIMPTDRNLKHEFVNEQLKASGKLN